MKTYKKPIIRVIQLEAESSLMTGSLTGGGEDSFNLGLGNAGEAGKETTVDANSYRIKLWEN